MNATGRRAWRKWIKRYRRGHHAEWKRASGEWRACDGQAKFCALTGAQCKRKSGRKNGLYIPSKKDKTEPETKVKPFKTMSLVGMTQGARKRAWLRGALNDYLFPHQNSTGAEHDVRSDYSWSEIRVDAPFLGTKLGERLRPCPGCSTCARPCHYCEMQEPDDSRCPRCGQVMYSTPICDGSGVLPARRSTSCPGCEECRGYDGGIGVVHCDGTGVRAKRVLAPEA